MGASRNSSSSSLRRIASNNSLLQAAGGRQVSGTLRIGTKLSRSTVFRPTYPYPQNGNTYKSKSVFRTSPSTLSGPTEVTFFALRCQLPQRRQRQRRRRRRCRGERRRRGRDLRRRRRLPRSGHGHGRRREEGRDGREGRLQVVSEMSSKNVQWRFVATSEKGNHATCPQGMTMSITANVSLVQVRRAVERGPVHPGLP